jgi:hypothetical protein
MLRVWVQRMLELPEHLNVTVTWSPDTIYSF